MSTLVRGLVADGAVRFLAVEVSDLADACAQAHGLSPSARRVAAEAIAATALMSAHIKGEERVTLQIHGDSPSCAFTGEVDAEGALRARLTPSHVPYGPLSGALLAIKADATRETYRGLTAIRQQRVPEALASHLATSDQVDVVLHIDGATGVLFERMPDVGGAAAGAAGGAAGAASLDPAAFRERYAGLDHVPDDAEILDVRPLVWKCRCSRAKVEDVLKALGPDELAAMRAEGGTSVTCHYCSVVYAFSADDIAALATT